MPAEAVRAAELTNTMEVTMVGGNVIDNGSVSISGNVSDNVNKNALVMGGGSDGLRLTFWDSQQKWQG